MSLFTREQWIEIGEHLELSPRQIDVARSICAGETYESTAIKLCISQDTVRTHVRELFRKLQVNDGLGLVLRLESAARTLNGGQSTSD